jgi:hypothetical protein
MDGDVSMISFDRDAETRKIVLGRDEELAIINGSWLHDVSSSDFEQFRRELTCQPDTDPKEVMEQAQILGGCATPP